MKNQLLAFAVLMLAAVSFSAQSSRMVQSINDNWRFKLDGSVTATDAIQWQKIDVPHTWNIDDTFDDEPGFHRGIGTYHRSLAVPSELSEKRLFLYFEAVNQIADVYINGLKAGSHTGGYSAFSIDITPFVRFGRNNSIFVTADNRFDENIPPLTGDFNFYGGIYRDVWLIATDRVHLDVTDMASSGVVVTTPEVSAKAATAQISAAASNDSNTERNLEIVAQILDSAGRPAGSSRRDLTVAGGNTAKIDLPPIKIVSPQLWSPDDPYLYSVRVSVREGGIERDAVTEPLGFRWFTIDAERGFVLNGDPIKLRGTNRHQDLQAMGFAVPDAAHVRDMQIIKDAGFNFVRLAHYPQDPAVLNAADRLGLLVWEETPILNYITTTPEFYDNCERYVREMIRQHRNHPSVIMWGYMNEIFLRVPKGRDDMYPATIELAKRLNAAAKQEDPSRPTTIAFHGSDIYNTAGLGDIADITGWNLYDGWYSNDLEDFGKFIDDQHRRFPKRPLIISEYGANADRRLHSLEPRRFDSTTEYQRKFHESYLSQIKSRPFIAGVNIWNQFDFAAEPRGENLPHLNNKGMFTYDRDPKDVHYFYAANYAKSPVLHIAVRDWPHRVAARPVKYPIDVYSNLPEIELFLNGRSLGKKRPNAVQKATWMVSLESGTNNFAASGNLRGLRFTDAFDVKYNAVSAASPFIAVNVGSNADFRDAGGTIWMADAPYKNGGFGWTGRDPLHIYGEPPHPNVLGTDDDPLFQTRLEGIGSYRFDVPPGNYEIELRFAEMKFERPGQRIFSVAINDSVVLRHLDVAAEIGWRRASTRKFLAETKGSIEVRFIAEKDRPMLSGISIRRIR